MGIITTTLSPAAKRLPLIAPIGEPEIWWTPYPKAEIVFNTSGEAVTKGEAADSQQLVINCDLQQSYAYVLMDLNLMLTSATDMADWNNISHTVLRDGVPPIWTQFIPFESNGAGGVATFTWRQFRHVGDITQKVLLAVNPGTRLAITIENPVVDGDAASASFFARFLQFDLNQGYRTSVNTPILVR